MSVQSSEPWDDAAEQSVLGAMLVSPGTVSDVLAMLRPEDLGRESHRVILETIRDLDGRGIVPDPVTVKDELRRSGRLAEVQNGALYLVHLAETVPNPASAFHYAGIVVDKARRRRLTSGLSKAIQRLEAGENVDGVIEAITEEGEVSPSESRLLGGWSFMEAMAGTGESVWGLGQEVLWSPGEPFYIVAPDGVGKTTLAQRLALARTGIRVGDLLGFPVQVTEEPVLYVAADRPAQAARSLRRMVEKSEADLLDDLVKVWKGPPPFDLAREPRRLAPWARSFGAATLILDSLKDVAMDLAQDETGLRVAAALNETVAEGIEVLVLHHPRKAQGENRKPNKIDDVYGSRWFTAGAGSVLSLWGSPGDPVVELRHLKQPAEPVGPLPVLIDHETGVLTAGSRADPLAILRTAGRGMTARDMAGALFGSSEPTDSEVEKARRRLEKLAARGLVHRKDGDRRASTPATYYPVTSA